MFYVVSTYLTLTVQYLFTPEALIYYNFFQSNDRWDLSGLTFTPKSAIYQPVLVADVIKREIICKKLVFYHL